MRKFVAGLIVLFFISSCVPKQNKVERTMESGAEVVVNHLEPYKIRGEHTILNLEEELRIDFAKDEFVELGLRNPEFVDSDSEGNIYLVDNYRASDFFICKFDRKGNFIKNFCRRGQGPGEVQYVYGLEIYGHDRIMVLDPRSKKIVEYDKNGNLMEENRPPPALGEVTPLENGNYLAYQVSGDPSSKDYGLSISLFNSRFDEIKTLDFYDLLKAEKKKKGTRKRDLYYWRVANGKIFMGNEQRGYEILVYDSEGNLLKKIRKEYEPAEYPEELRRKMVERFKDDPNVSPLKYTPPFNSFFLDDDGRLFVMTYEQKENREGYIHDIFNSDGIFIGRKVFNEYSGLGIFLNPLRATSKNNRFYRIHSKEDGNLELVVYKMKWE